MKNITASLKVLSWMVLSLVWVSCDGSSNRGSVKNGETEVIVGNMIFTLPAGFIHEPKEGTDTEIGCFVSQAENLEVWYSFGVLAHEYADPEWADLYLWFKSEIVDNGGNAFLLNYALDKIVYLEDKVRPGPDRFVLKLTFPNEPPTEVPPAVDGGAGNFSVEIENDEQIDRVLGIMRTAKSALVPPAE